MDEHLADLLTTLVPAIIDQFEAALLSVDSPLLKDELSRTQILMYAREMVEKTADEIGGRVRSETRDLAWESGATHATMGIHLNESLRASDLLFGAVIGCLSSRLSSARIGERMALVALTLHRILAAALRAAADSYVGVLLNRGHQAQVDERRRISRELHDRIGHGVAVAQRDLELFEVYRVADPDRALARVWTARRRLTEAMDGVRQSISDLRLIEPLESLENAVRLFLESAANPELVRHVEVNGNETWAPAETIEEAFLIIREALRNTVAHAEARQVLVQVDISPDEFRASVIDDGQGFDPAVARRGGSGVLSMRERAALLGGSLRLTSAPGHGTQVELWVPLTGGA